MAIDDVILGCANQAGEDNRNVARMASLLAGYPVAVPGTTINRLCGSGMDAVLCAARAINCGQADVIIAGGVENMSRAPFVMPKAHAAFSRNTEIHDTTMGWRFINAAMRAAYGTDSMPETAENVAEQFDITRQDQDAFAYRSQKRAHAAQTAGTFDHEIVPVTVALPKNQATAVTIDEGLRADTTMEALARLPTPFRKNGTVTAGTASGINDGAAALLIASEAAVTKFNLRPLVRILGGAVAGVSPRIMGFGPVPATVKLCERLKLAPADFQVIEVNEAFAAQVLSVTRELGFPDDAPHVNRNGGAIALGHPLGASGARITGAAALELRRAGGRRALATMCIGVGQGIAIALETV
jgi:acetyl-CoA acyltransferase